MAADAADLMKREYRIARRLARLFRIERCGRLARCPHHVVARLLDRRARLIDEMRRLEERRRSFEPWTPSELGLAMGALANEVSRTEQYCLERVAELGAALARRRGGEPTGLRDSGRGRLLGQG